jgi:PAS domain S-box-containing protein
MNPLNNLSIKYKLIAIVLAVTTFCTGLAFSINIIRDIKSFKADLLTGSIVTARLIGENCKFPLVFNDAQGAHDVLTTLEAIPTVYYACVLNGNGDIFAEYSKTGIGRVNYNDAIPNGFDETRLRIAEKIVHEREQLGTIFLIVSTAELTGKIRKNILYLLFNFLGLLLVSYLIAARLQGIIADPIRAITNFTERITREKNYSLRTIEVGADEIGHLQKSVNLMVSDLEANIQSLTSEIQVRKAAETDANRLRSTLRNIIDSMPSILIAVDTEAKVMQWNYEAFHFTGIPPAEAYGKVITEIFPLLKGYATTILETIQAIKPYKISNLTQKDSDGRTLYLDVTIYPLTEHGNEGAVIRLDDISDKTRMEAVMIQSEKMMSVGGLAAGMAHEINNPLGIILQATQNIKRRISPSLPKNVEVAKSFGFDLNNLNAYLTERKIMDYLEGIMESVGRASSIVSNMLQFSRQSIQSKTPSNIAEIINRSIALAANDYDLKKKFDFRHIEIIREFDETLPHVPCTVGEIEQVLLNLLKNAAQAMAEVREHTEKSRIIVRSLRENTMARLEIEDNGPGIKEEIKKRIFEPFFTTKEVGVGTGLGLSVSYFIITKNHKGTIEVESEYRKGTKFIIRLPLIPES